MLNTSSLPESNPSTFEPPVAKVYRPEQPRLQLPDQSLSSLITDPDQLEEVLTQLDPNYVREHPEFAALQKIAALRAAANRVLPKSTLQTLAAWWYEHTHAKNCPVVKQYVGTTVDTAKNFPSKSPDSPTAEAMFGAQHGLTLELLTEALQGKAAAPDIKKRADGLPHTDVGQFIDAHRTAHAGAEAARYLLTTEVVRRPTPEGDVIKQVRTKLGTLCLQLEIALDNRIHTTIPGVGGIEHFYTRGMYRASPHYPMHFETRY
jgi:hypothetical protein